MLLKVKGGGDIDHCAGMTVVNLGCLGAAGVHGHSPHFPAHTWLALGSITLPSLSVIGPYKIIVTILCALLIVSSAVWA